MVIDVVMGVVVDVVMFECWWRWWCVADDGFGNDDHSCSLIQGEKVSLTHSAEEYGSIGKEMANVGIQVGLKADPQGLDLAGKVMGLAAYGLIDREYYDKISHYGFTNIKSIWNYKSWHRKWDKDFDINWLSTSVK